MREQLPALLYLFAIFAFAVVVWWAVMNDEPGLRGGDRGLLAIGRRSEDPSKDGDERSKRWRRPR